MKRSIRVRAAAVALGAALTGALIAAPASPVFAIAKFDATPVELSPNTNGGGVLPSGHAHLRFTLSNGNWTDRVTLPSQPNNGDRVDIVQNAGYSTTVNAAKFDFGVDLPMVTGEKFTFVYDTSIAQWKPNGDLTAHLSPNSTGATIPNNPRRFTYYTMANGNWTSAVTLPAVAADRSLILVRSRATYSASVNAANVLYQSTMQIKTGDTYVFEYRVNPEAGVSKWVIVNAPTREVTPSAVVPAATSPRTQMTIPNGLSTVTLPANSADRNRIIIRSTSDNPATIVAPASTASGPLTIRKGEEYVFLYIAEQSRWAVSSAPDTTYRLVDLPNGTLPALTTPRTMIVADSFTQTPTTFTLPSAPPIGSRVTLENKANYTVTVVAGAQSIPILIGETVAFIVGTDGAWKRETVTIDYVLVYSDKAAAQYGAATMQQRLKEGFDLTNQALENSGANFRLRAVALNEIVIPTTWTTMSNAINGLRVLPAAQDLLNTNNADALYYEGTESDVCGLAFRTAAPDKELMIAGGNAGCRTESMRHEIGHNMGLTHANESTGTNRGYQFVKSVMGGNAIPYYSTPNRFDPANGIAYGIANTIDGVKYMNGRSEAVSNFR